MSETLPRGIWFEEHRNQYRVRVRRKNRIIHQTRHPATPEGLNEARRSLRRGQKLREWIIEHENEIGHSDSARIEALARNLV